MVSRFLRIHFTLGYDLFHTECGVHVWSTTNSEKIEQLFGYSPDEQKQILERVAKKCEKVIEAEFDSVSKRMELP